MPNLAAAEERWRLTIDHAPIGIALVSLEGRFERVNEAFCAIFGFSAEEFAELDFEKVTPPEDLDHDRSLLRQVRDGEIPHYRSRKHYLRANGEVLWADISVSMVRSGRGKPLHFVAYVIDRTEEVAATDRIERINRDLSAQSARLERSNADLEAFAVVASHDLQAPLTTVRGYLELLQGEYADRLDARAAGWIERSAQAAERMSELLDSLLAFSRSTTGSADKRRKVSVVALVREVVHDLGPVLQEHGAVVEVAPDCAQVVAQRAPLRQVLQNLVQNTVKYRHPERPPRAEVSVTEREDDWLVTVTDNGLGVPDEDKESVFSMFARARTDVDGHGIGLATSRRIVERHGGSIWVEDNPGGGSRFCFTLPR